MAVSFQSLKPKKLSMVVDWFCSNVLCSVPNELHLKEPIAEPSVFTVECWRCGMRQTITTPTNTSASRVTV
jgi:hypothetical protein